MNLQHSNYHRVLRIALLVCAVMLVFDSGLVSRSTADLSDGTQQYLANVVGASAQVAPTELNQYTAALTTKEKELDEREAALEQREIAVSLSAGGRMQDSSTYLLASILFILLVLILLNYTLDYLRSRERRDMQTV